MNLPVSESPVPNAMKLVSGRRFSLWLAGIVGEHGVEDRIGDLIRDLVGMPLRDRLGGEEEVARHSAGKATEPV